MKKKLWRTWAWGISAVTAGTAVASQISLTAQAADNITRTIAGRG